MSKEKPTKVSLTYPVKDPKTGKPAPGGMTLTVTKAPPSKAHIDDYEKLSHDKRKPVFPCEPGVKWEEIKFTLISDDTVRIATPESTENFSFQELGMMDKRTDAPKADWHFLKIGIIAGGSTGPGEFDYSKYNTTRSGKIRSTDPYKIASNLNKHLQGLFKINESIYVKPYGEDRKYTLRFKVENRTELTQF